MAMSGRTNADLAANGFDRIADAERFTALSRSTLYKLLNGGILSYTKVGKSRRIPHADLVRLMTERLVVRPDA
jgi:excisionase family DNA binding protein